MSNDAPPVQPGNTRTYNSSRRTRLRNTPGCAFVCGRSGILRCTAKCNDMICSTCLVHGDSCSVCRVAWACGACCFNMDIDGVTNVYVCEACEPALSA